MPASEVKEEKSFVIVIPSYNNQAYVERNLTSVIEQKYQNYRVIYIDDASTDDTYNKVVAFIENHGCEERFTLIHNQTNYKALYNLYYAIQSANNDEIIVLLDGDDQLAHPGVLGLLNQYYNDENVWLTYGQYITYPQFEKGMCRETFLKALSRGKIRHPGMFVKKTDWVFSHLRTFYAGLFKRIHLRDLLYQGKFFGSAWDLAIMFPMLEMAREHAVFIPEVLYIYNRETPLNDDKLRQQEQLFFNDLIRTFSPYQRLHVHPTSPISLEKTAHLVIFSEDSPLQLYAFLESLEKYANGFHKIMIYYQAEEEACKRAYLFNEERFKHCSFMHIKKGDQIPLREQLLQTLSALDGNYVALVDDTCIIKDILNVEHAISLLEMTGAFGFYCNLGLHIQNLPETMVPVGSSSFAWELSRADNAWNANSLLQMSLFRVSDIMQEVKNQKFTNISDLRKLSKASSKGTSMGLCYKDSKAVIIPMKMIKIDTREEIVLYTNSELTERFLDGFKMDITSVFQMKNSSPLVEHYPKFILR